MIRALLRYLGWVDRKPGDMWPFPFAGFQPRCSHPAYRENLACHGVCASCGQDLGFVGDLRAAGNSKEIGYASDVHQAQGWKP